MGGEQLALALLLLVLQAGAGPLPRYDDGVLMNPPVFDVCVDGNGRLYAAAEALPDAPVTVVE